MATKFNLDETYLLFSFEKFFHFEFYLRNLAVNQKDEFDALKQMPSKIKATVDQLPFKQLLYENLKLLDSDDVLRIVLDYMQYKIFPLEQLLDEGNSGTVIEILKNICEHIGSNYKINLECNYYKYSDLINKNNIFEVIDYWNNLILNPEIRKRLNLSGSFGNIGEVVKLEKNEAIKDVLNADVNEKVSYINKILFPFHCPGIQNPCSRSKDSNNNFYEILELAESTEFINANKNIPSIELKISLEQNPVDIDLILKEFKQRFILLQMNYIVKAIEKKSQDLPEFLNDTKMFDFEKFYQETQKID